MKKFRMLLTQVLFCFFLVTGQAQSQDFMRSTGKINVVFGVIFIIFSGIIIFLIVLDRKLSKLENRINHE